MPRTLRFGGPPPDGPPPPPPPPRRDESRDAGRIELRAARGSIMLWKKNQMKSITAQNASVIRLSLNRERLDITIPSALT